METPAWQQTLYHTVHLFPLSHHISSNRFTSHPISCRNILILCSYLRLVLLNCLLLSCFPTKTLYAPLPPCVTYHNYLIFLNLIIREIFVGKCRSFSSSLFSLLLLGSYFFFSTLFSNTISLRSSFYTIDQISHTYKQEAKL